MPACWPAVETRQPAGRRQPEKSGGSIPHRPPVDPEKAAAQRQLADAGMTPGRAAKQLGIGRSAAYRLVGKGKEG